jgi:lipopolysaccharide cholinephosphotransferase
MNEDEAFRKLDRQFQLYKDCKTSSMGFAYLAGMTLYYKEFYPIRKMKFEGFDVNMPNDYDAYLKRDYGDYMTLPPLEKRVTHKPLILSFTDDYNGVWDKLQKL